MMELGSFRRGRVLDNKKESGKILILKSDRRGSNPRSRPWQGRALPTTPLSHVFCLEVLFVFLSDKTYYTR